MLLDRLRPMMLRYFSRRLSPKLACKSNQFDLAQDVCVLALEGFADFRGATLAKFRSWLMAICRNAWRLLARIFAPGSRTNKE